MRGLINAASSRAQLLSTLPGTVIAVLLFAPVAYLLYTFLTLNLLSVAAAGLLLGVFFCACLPLINVAAPQRPWRAVVLPLIGAGICIGVGIVQSHRSALHPRRDTLLYSLNADNHIPVWISYDDTLDAFTSRVFGNQTATRKPMPDFLAGSQRPVLSGPAPAVDLPPPISEIKTDDQSGDTHTIRMNVRSQRDAHLILIRFDPSVQPVSVKISGRNLTPRPNSTGLTLLLHGMDAQGADLELALKAPSGISFWISDYSVGLPTTQRRGSDVIAAQGSDETLVVRKYTLGKPAQ